MKQLPRDKSSYLAPAKKNPEVFAPETTFDDSPANSTGFTSGGNPSESCPTCTITLEDGKDNPACYAKKLVYSDRYGIREKFFVKVNSQGHMFDPWGPMMEGTQSQFDRWHGKPKWGYLEVNARAFEFYKMFLQTRNKSWKHNAEREVNNG